MVDLNSIQNRLNNNTDEMEEFLTDPVRYLHKEGLTLSFEMEQELISSIKNFSNPIKGINMILGIISNSSPKYLE